MLSGGVVVVEQEGGHGVTSAICVVGSTLFSGREIKLHSLCTCLAGGRIYLVK